MSELLKNNIDKIIPLINLIILLIFLVFKNKSKLILNNKKTTLFFEKKYFDYFFLIFIFIFIINYLNNYFSPYFITDLHENSWMNTSIAFSKNINPLNVNTASEYANLYSTVWPLIVSKFYFLVDLKIFSLKNLMHTINLIVFLFFCIIISLFLEKKNIVNISLLFTIFYLIFTQRNNLGSSPHTIGMFFYILGIFITYFKRENQYLLLSLIFITFATLFKQYFFLGFFLVIIPNLNNINKEKIIYFFIWLIISALIYFLLNFNFELYFDIHYNYYLSYSKFVKFELYRIIYEIGYIFKYFPFLIILIFVALLNFDFKNKFKKNFLITSILIICFIVIKMWTNTGNFGIYSLQLIFPIFLIYIIEYLNKIKNNLNFLRFINIIICLSIMINLHNDFGFINKNKIENNRNLFAKIKEIIKENNINKIYLDKGLNLIDKKNKVLNYDYGHKLHIENYLDLRKNGFLKRTSIEEYFLKKIDINKVNKNYKLDKKLFSEEKMINFNNFEITICSICPNFVNDYKIESIGELYINSLKPTNIKTIFKTKTF